MIPAIHEVSISMANALSKCGDFVYSIDCDSCHSKHFGGFSSCKSRWCIPCNHKKTLAWLAKLMPVLETWQGRVGMLNFTIETGTDLAAQIKKLQYGWRRFNNDPYIRKHFKNRLVGGLRSLEVKISSGDSTKWHAHLHCLILQPKGNDKDFDWIREKWNSATGGSVWIKDITNQKLKGSVEVLKYLIKPEMGLYNNNVMLSEAVEALKGKRQINTWGLLRGLAKEVEELEDTWEEKKLTAFVCSKCGCTEGELVKMLYKDSLDFEMFNVKRKG